jgi:hypothetical protein
MHSATHGCRLTPEGKLITENPPNCKLYYSCQLTSTRRTWQHMGRSSSTRLGDIYMEAR